MLALPRDSIRQIQWRFADRFDLQMLVQSARSVARGTVARLVAAGERNTHEWTPGINAMAADVVSDDGSHLSKAGRCAGRAGAEDFLLLQNKVTRCLSGDRLAKDRAAAIVSTVMIPEALDYPV